MKGRGGGKGEYCCFRSAARLNLKGPKCKLHAWDGAGIDGGGLRLGLVVWGLRAGGLRFKNSLLVWSLDSADMTQEAKLVVKNA